MYSDSRGRPAEGTARPWWPPILAAAAGAEHRTALTSRNSWLPVRRAIASRAPDLLKANGGGANAILARVPIDGHRCGMLTQRPERRVAHGVRVGDGGWVANLHATTRPTARTRTDVGGWRAERAEVLDAAALSDHRPVRVLVSAV